jgi:nucleoid-associated protein YgaU
VNEALKKLESLLQNAAAGSQPFPPNSRYNGQPVLTTVTADGREVSYLARRVVPQPEDFATLETHVVSADDRLDLLSARYQGDPEQWWRLADANGAVRPGELIETPGRRLRVTLAAGIPAGTDD